MVPIIAVVGWSNSGKTTFITKLIPLLKERGYKVAAVKHNAHKFEIDNPGKDSWQHRKAGADTVILSSKEKVALIRKVKEEIKVEKLVDNYVEAEFDLVVVEGYKTGRIPKIEIFRPDLYEEPVISGEELLVRIINTGDNFEELLSSKAEEVIPIIEKEVLKNN